KSLSSR
ncbi:hypothetical protein D030_3535B, partial [Vibrio parahaemolyticus AQ3810]